MQTRTLGTTGPTVSALGLGCMGMSDLYGPADRDAGLATIRAALDAGLTLFDTGDFYGMGHNEMLLADGLADVPRESVTISVKFGAMRDPRGNWIGVDGRPVAVKTSLAYSLKRLKTDYIDIYRLARVDPAVPTEETIGAIGEMIDAGYVRYVGLSETGADTIRRAAAVRPIADVQIEYAVISRDIEAAILPACREVGCGVTAYGVLGRGLLSGHWDASTRVQRGDFRAYVPRFQGENLAKNLQLVETLRTIADELGMTVAQLAIAWVMSRGIDIVPLIGARRPDRLAESLGALDLTLDGATLDRIEAAIPPGAASGTRYDAHQMAILDSEK